ncbi:hypothetical protein VTO73DRAFT_2083 [Trametes versicolor]
MTSAYDILGIIFDIISLFVCGGGTDPITVTLGGEKTVSTTTTIDANVGFELDGFTHGVGDRRGIEYTRSIRER